VIGLLLHQNADSFINRPGQISYLRAATCCTPPKKQLRYWQIARKADPGVSLT